MRGAGAVAAIISLMWSVGTVAGGAWVQSWDVVKRGHFRIVAWSAVGLAALALPSALAATEGIQGGSVQRVFVGLFSIAAVVYLLAQYRAEAGPAAIVGFGATAVGIMVLAVTAALMDNWSPLVSIPALVSGAALLGAVTNGMLLGHWYLNQPGLQPWALARITTAGLAVTVLTAAIGLAGARDLIEAPTAGAALGLPGFGEGFGPAFFFIWLALVGFTGAVLYGVKRCIAIRSIQSATGLYYVAILMAGVAEFLVRYLMVNSA